MLSAKADDRWTRPRRGRAAGRGAQPTAAPDIRTAPHGTPIDSVEKARTLGHTQNEIKAIQEISTDNDVIIRTRPGSEDRLKLLEAGGIGKPEHIKRKSINAADLELGFRKDDLGKIGHLTDEMYARLKQRRPASLSADGRRAAPAAAHRARRPGRRPQEARDRASTSASRTRRGPAR